MYAHLNAHARVVRSYAHLRVHIWMRARISYARPLLREWHATVIRAEHRLVVEVQHRFGNIHFCMMHALQ